MRPGEGRGEACRTVGRIAEARVISLMDEDKADRDVLLAQRVDPSADQPVADSLSLMAGRDGTKRPAVAAQRTTLSPDLHAADTHGPNTTTHPRGRGGGRGNV